VAAPVTSPPLPGWKRLLFGVVCLVGVPLLLLVVLEGGSSLLLLVADLYRTPPQLTERPHTQYDTLLGWVNRPDFYDHDLYAPGVYLRTNSQGFRNDHAITPRVPPGRARAICSGDSFTLGYGVDNDHTWCALLEHRIHGLETVNMGQGGYGADQAYLWYKRDAEHLDHQVQIFAVILEDFRRAARRSFQGFGKPVLRAVGDSLVVDNVPVPRWPYRMPRLAAYLAAKRPLLARLQIVQLEQGVWRRFTGSSVKAAEESDSAMWPVADRMFRDLARLNRSKHSTLVVVFLPIPVDWKDTGSDRLRRWLAEAAPRDGYLFVDLVEEFRRLPSDSLDRLFLESHPHSHHGVVGHEWIAAQLSRRLLEVPGVAAVLASDGLLWTSRPDERLSHRRNRIQREAIPRHRRVGIGLQ
jgi:hypothetical protein